MDQSAFSIFAAIVSSIVLEASPFLLLGSLLSAVLAVYVGDGALARLSRRGLPAQIGVGLVAGLILPTCECGVVPVTRRLLGKGVPPGAAISFMNTHTTCRTCPEIGSGAKSTLTTRPSAGETTAS